MKFTIPYLITLGLVTTSAKALAFPEMIRHGYSNCVSCHVSPTGGQILNPYGRMMSGEVLSTFSQEREAEFLHGLLPEESLDAWLIGGGDVRILQVHRETPDRITGTGFLMQAALDFAARIEKWTLMMSVGRPNKETRSIDPYASSYYLMYNPTPQWALRVGQFYGAFGVRTPYHTLPTRQSLGFGPGQETKGFEAYYSGLDWDYGSSLMTSENETFLTMKVNRHFGQSSKAGFSGLLAKADDQKRWAIGSHALLGLSHQWSWIGELTAQVVHPENSKASTGVFHFSQLVYEPIRGVNLYLLEDYEKSNLNDSRSVANSVGVGAKFYPRPHFEFDLLFSKKRTLTVADRYDDMAWILTHYYF